MSPSLVVLPGRTGRSVVHPFGGGWTTVAKSARASGCFGALVPDGRPDGGALWTKEPVPAVDHLPPATAVDGAGGYQSGRGGHHPSVVVRGKRCQVGHFVAAFPARPNPGDDFRDPFEHVRPWPTGGAAEQGSHSVQGVAVGGHFPG